MCIYFLIMLSNAHATNYSLLQLARKHYEPFAGSGTTLIIFDGNQVRLNIPRDGTVTKEGWKITPFNNPTVSGTENCLYCTVT